jgi:hypothetical protein
MTSKVDKEDEGQHSKNSNMYTGAELAQNSLSPILTLKQKEKRKGKAKRNASELKEMPLLSFCLSQRPICPSLETPKLKESFDRKSRNVITLI